ncbi:GAP1-N1 domain-containing protein [Pseudomonas fluorescens]
MNPLIPTIHHQLHGYRSGHQLLNSTIRLDRRDQDLIDRLSDMAGPLRPGEMFDPYLSCYPLPSEDFYVLSRTRQDNDAPRAGCVITQTILVPMDYWEKSSNLAGLIEILESDLPEGEPVSIRKFKSGHLPTVKAGFTTELLEALFLEKRSPIVVFTDEKTEDLTIRLLSALWPAMRRRFSVCTLSLAPRMLMGRPFDLLFAPKGARSRFKEWSGRRIDSLNKESHPRHRWTDTLVYRVFQSNAPSLMSPHSQSLLSGGAGDESMLRLTLLWEELEEKSKESSAAVLGLLDIANSKQVLNKVWPVLEPILLRAIESTLLTGQYQETWSFVHDMAAKLVGVPSEFVDPLIDRVILLASRDVRSAMVIVNAARSENLLSSQKLLGAIAQHINPVDLKYLLPELMRLDSHKLLFLFVYNPSLLSVLSLELESSAEKALIDKLVEALDIVAVEARNSYLSLFSKYIREPSQAPLLQGLLREANPQMVVEVATTIWENFKVHELGMVICGAALDSGARKPVREIFAQGCRTAYDLKLVLELTNYSKSDLKWLITSDATQDCREELLCKYIAKATTTQLEGAFVQKSLAYMAIDYLMPLKKKYSKSVALVLSLKIVDAKKAIGVAPKVFDFLSSVDRENLLRKVADKLLSEADLLKKLLPEFAGAFPNDVTVEVLLNSARGHFTSYFQVDEIISILDGVDGLNLYISNSNLDFLLEWVVGKVDFDLSKDAASFMSKMLERLKFSNYSQYEVISLNLLPILMNSRVSTASVMLVQVFPAVYEMLRKEEGGLKFNRLFSFTDWDKCKAARKKLVRTFLKSDWSQLDFARIAFFSRDTRRIFKDLVQEPKGPEYMQRIKLSSKELDGVCRREVLDEIQRLQAGGLELM